jgi:hypothetical protein
MTTADDKVKDPKPFKDCPGFTPETLNVHPDLSGARDPESEWQFGDLTVSTHKGRDAFWVVVRRPGQGGVALRTFPIMGAYDLRKVTTDAHGAEWEVKTNPGLYRISLRLEGERLRMTSRLTPSHDLLVVFWPRDLYVLDANDDPREAKGHVEAAQRGLNGGYCYFCLNEPEFGNVLYMQNLTALNPFFKETKTTPDGVVGGEWPELGYQPPAAPTGVSPPVDPLPQGKEVVVSDALLVCRYPCAEDEFTMARTFIEMLATLYPHIDKPLPKPRDWLWRAKQTLHDLKTAPVATIEHYGHTYLHPYTASEYPDSMVQMSVLTTLREYELAHGFKDPFSDELAAGMRKFYDEDLKTLRRYLPNVGADKDKDAVDSWYLYHPLMNLARLAINGEDWAKDLFFDGLEFVIKAAQHFDYVWPIIYKVTDFSVVTQARNEDGLGQTDVGGIYAYVMLQAHQLTGDQRYIDEAKKALKALENFRFELAYQTNLTAWGAVACLKLSKLEQDAHYLDQSLVFVASVVHNCELWDSQLNAAEHYANFFGVTCLHDGPYLAAYEVFECFMAFDEYLQEGGDDVPNAVRLLLAEYWRFAQDVLWSFYPDALPEDALAKDIRNGHIEPSLSFPVEDIYGDGSPAGQVGQEIYGAGAAFVVAARAFAECPGTPFRIATDYPMDIDCSDGVITVRLLGPEGYSGRIRLLPKDEGAPPHMAVLTKDGEPVTAVEDGVYEVAGNGRYTIMWQPAESMAV